MRYYQDSTIQIFFGDKSVAVDPRLIRGKRASEIVDQKPFSVFQKKALSPLRNYFFLHQTHGIEGGVVTEQSLGLPLFTQEGDYLLTNRFDVGIGVATADCLPVVFVDPIKKAIGVVHAGWKGLVAGVVEQAVERMRNEYDSFFMDINFIVGPSAQGCCYEVGKDFFKEASALRPSIEKFLEAALFLREGRIFFDSILFFKLIFFEKGLAESNFNFSYAECTICKPIYCSYRREKMSPLRQLTIVSLKY
jgi:YfiH family protein